MAIKEWKEKYDYKEIYILGEKKNTEKKKEEKIADNCTYVNLLDNNHGFKDT